MMRSLRLLAGYIYRYFLEVMAWRSFLFTLVVNQAVAPLIGLAVWSAALPGNAAVSAYYVALLAVQLMTVSYEHHTFSNGIYAGNLTQDLLRPHPVVLVPLGANLAIRVWHLLAGLPLIILAGATVGASFNPGALLAAFPAVALAAVLRFLFTYVLALSAFWTERAHGVVGLGETLIFLLGGAAAPVTLFPESIRPLGEALPFWAMLGFPAAIASGSLSGGGAIEGYGWQVFWIATFAPAAVLGWKSGVRRYTAVGG
jgi:ABC-2 type transport system permease protein